MWVLQKLSDQSEEKSLKKHFFAGIRQSNKCILHRINIVAKNGLRWAGKALRYEAQATPIGRKAVLDPMKNSKLRRSLDSASKNPCHPEPWHCLRAWLGAEAPSLGPKLASPTRDPEDKHHI